MSKFHEYVEDWYGDKLHVKQLHDEAGAVTIFINSESNEGIAIGESDVDVLISVLTRAKEHIQANKK